MRELCGGTIGNIVDAVLDAGEEEFEWQFELVEGKEGDEALRIVWLAFEREDGEVDHVTQVGDEHVSEGEDPDYDDVDEALGEWEREEDDGWAPAESASTPGGWR